MVALLLHPLSVVALGALGLWALVNLTHVRVVTGSATRQIRVVAGSVLLPLAAVAVVGALSGTSAHDERAATLALLAAATTFVLSRVLRVRLQGPVRVVVVGDRVAIAQAVSRWRGSRKARPVCALLVEHDLDPADVPHDVMGVPVVPGLESAAETVSRTGADLVVVVPDRHVTATDFRRLAWALEETRVGLGVLGILDSVAPHRITPNVVHGATVNEVRPPKPPARVRAAKQLSDRVLAGVALVVLSPVLFALMLAVRIDSRGPIFYTQTRIGLKGRPFTVYKLRTMVRDADAAKAELQQCNEQDGVLFKLRDDPRITRVGRWLRRSSLDELPQLLNVVMGDMSLVGPRPHLPEEVAQMDRDALRRLAVRPGITGLWQVSGRSNLSWDEAVLLDTYYADNWNLAGDLAIAVRTVRAVASGDGAY
jgi:exopolysaccharide biosynthesis polyprenyl glycosylphosphotransferase